MTKPIASGVQSIQAQSGTTTLGDTNNPKSTSLSGRFENPQSLLSTGAKAKELSSSRFGSLISAASNGVKAVYNAAISVFTRTPAATAKAAASFSNTPNHFNSEEFRAQQEAVKFRGTFRPDYSLHLQTNSQGSQVSYHSDGDTSGYKSDSGYHSE